MIQCATHTVQIHIDQFIQIDSGEISIVFATARYSAVYQKEEEEEEYEKNNNRMLMRKTINDMGVYGGRCIVQEYDCNLHVNVGKSLLHLKLRILRIWSELKGRERNASFSLSH